MSGATGFYKKRLQNAPDGTPPVHVRSVIV